ncbi:ABC transporter ATP-binding protein [Actinopolymorpha sp. B9G3]|uniref:ABC transporter ATP-binding protein n=1 Tax=Actinopolymorpha sp. B9G3 TaxID=3158970 RepID=UPI0032D93B43
MFTLLRYMFRIAPASAATSLALAIASAGLSVLLTFLVGQVVGAVPGVIANKPDALSLTAFSLLLAALLAAFLVESMLPTFDQMIGLNLDNHVHRALAIGITEPVLRPRRIAHLEDPQIKDIQDHAKGKAGFQVGRGVRNVRWLLSSRLTLFGSAALVGQMFSWPVAIGLVAVTLFMEYYRATTCERELDSWFGNTEGQRQADYAFNLGMRDAPKELRVFGLGSFLVDRYVAKWTESFRPVWEARRRGTVAAIGVGVIHLGAQAGAVLLVGRAALAGDLPLTQVATTVPAILAVGMSYNGFGVMMIRRALSAYRSMRDLPKLIAERYPEPVAEVNDLEVNDIVDKMPREAIRFENVSFRYPGSDHEVLSGLDLEIRAGEALALVGVNGAGKSTLVKLLGGAYQPTSGRITIDGTDLAELDLGAWQRRVAAIVQDFLRFPLPATDNVVLGAVEHAKDPGALELAAREAGIEDVINALPDKWDTILDKTYDGGVDLSGGEWQRLALARALFAVHAGAGVLVLDEPAAALDARAEAQLVERYLELTSGVTSLIISHRFSVVRDAHRICVLADGRITESGSHDELVKLGGTYASMFRLQAERYVTGERDTELEAVDG